MSKSAGAKRINVRRNKPGGKLWCLVTGDGFPLLGRGSCFRSKARANAAARAERKARKSW